MLDGGGNAFLRLVGSLSSFSFKASSGAPRRIIFCVRRKSDYPCSVSQGREDARRRTRSPGDLGFRAPRLPATTRSHERKDSKRILLFACVVLLPMPCISTRLGSILHRSHVRRGSILLFREVL